MKKNSIVKTLFVTFLTIVLLSCFIKTSSVSGNSVVLGEVSSIGIVGFAQVLYNSIISHLDALVLIVMIGIMYGVLNKTNAYQELVYSIANKFKGKEKVILVISIVFFALISSLFGLQIELFIFIPFITSILMFLGYDKKTVFASTFGSIIVGTIGATFNSLVLGGINNYYSVSYTSQIVVKAFILIISMFLYVTHIIKRGIISTDGIEYLDIPNFEETKITNRKKLPVILYIIVISLLVIAGTFKIGNIFGIQVFTNVRNALNDMDLFKNIFGVVPVFSKLGYIDLAYMIFISTLIIGFIYAVKIDDMIDGMYKGASRVLPASIVVLFVLAIPEICINYPFYLTIVSKILSHFKNFNIFISSIVVFITSIFVPTTDGVVGILPVINASASSDINVMTLISQTIFGITMLIAPSSVMLMFGLSYEKIGYIEWIKYIIKFFLYMLVILFAIFLIVVML